MSFNTESDDSIRIAFMCVRNAGRSQMSTAFEEREREQRGLEDSVEILTGGTHPADYVHDQVVNVMDEAGFDLSGLTPREITLDELRYVATMGCSTLDVGDVGEDVDARDWALEDPDGQDPDRVREIRDEIEQRVVSLFDEFSTAE
jgi:protein-tyrosine-phosphatase